MTCETVPLPGGGTAILCGRQQPKMKCRSCGQPADLLCDWKTPEGRYGTCDAPICTSCTTKPAPNKDLCPTHAAAYERWSAEKADREANLP